MNCFFCERDSESGVLCSHCADEQNGGAMLCLEQVYSSVTDASLAAVIDQFGRPHPLAEKTKIGRESGPTTMTILQGTVSRNHATIFSQSPSEEGASRNSKASSFWVLDEGSGNGTTVNGEKADGAVNLKEGDIIFFGSVGFRFTEKAHLLPADENLQIGGGTILPGDGNLGLQTQGGLAATNGPTGGAAAFSKDEKTDPGLPMLILRLYEPTGGGGGIAEVSDQQIQLGHAQFALVQLLSKRMIEDSHQPSVVRGFVRTTELIASLPWDTSHPGDNHLKQLVRRTRKAFASAGVEHFIDSRSRFGYRLFCIPSN